jgi:hypothetical protein
MSRLDVWPAAQARSRRCSGSSCFLHRQVAHRRRSAEHVRRRRTDGFRTDGHSAEARHRSGSRGTVGSRTVRHERQRWPHCCARPPTRARRPGDGAAAGRAVAVHASLRRPAPGRPRDAGDAYRDRRALLDELALKRDGLADAASVLGRGGLGHHHPQPTPRGGGGVRFGLGGHQRDQLRAALQRLEEPTRRRSGVRRVRPCPRSTSTPTAGRAAHSAATWRSPRTHSQQFCPWGRARLTKSAPNPQKGSSPERRRRG